MQLLFNVYENEVATKQNEFNAEYRVVNGGNELNWMRGLMPKWTILFKHSISVVHESPAEIFL